MCEGFASDPYAAKTVNCILSRGFFRKPRLFSVLDLQVGRACGNILWQF